LPAAIADGHSKRSPDVDTVIKVNPCIRATPAVSQGLLYWANQNNHIWVTCIIRGDSKAVTPTEQAYEAIGNAHFAERRNESNRIRMYLGDEP